MQDMDGESHTVEVTAATLYEAVAQGLAAIRRNEWVAAIGSNVVNVWSQMFASNTKLSSAILRNGRTGQAALREASDRHRIRSILGLSVSGSIGSFLHQIGAWTRPAQLAKNQY